MTMIKGGDPLRLLVHSNCSERFVPQIMARFPNIHVSVHETYDGLSEVLEREGPEIVLSHKFENAVYPGSALTQAESVRWIHCGGTGIDHFVPWDGARLTITNSPGLAAAAMAEYALGSIYALNLNLLEFVKRQQAHEWTRGSVRETEGQTALVVGLGSIGRKIASRLKAANLYVIGVRSGNASVEEADETWPVTELLNVLPRADHIVVIVPLTQGTKGLFDQKAFELIKPGASLINLSRGGVIDEDVLYSVLKNGGLRGAVLDVFEHEPLPPDNPFWDLGNVIITAHSAGFVEGWQEKVRELFCENLALWIEGLPLNHVLSPKDYGTK